MFRQLRSPVAALDLPIMGTAAQRSDRPSPALDWQVGDDGRLICHDFALIFPSRRGGFCIPCNPPIATALVWVWWKALASHIIRRLAHTWSLLLLKPQVITDHLLTTNYRKPLSFEQFQSIAAFSQIYPTHPYQYGKTTASTGRRYSRSRLAEG